MKFNENGKEKFDTHNKNHQNINEGSTPINPLFKIINRLNDRL